MGGNKKKPVKKVRRNKVDTSFEGLENGTYTVVFNPDSGLELRDKNGKLVSPTKLNSKLFYERESNPKVLSYSDGAIKPYENASNVLKNYEYLCAIDTNTRKINGRTLSVSIICIGRWYDEGEYTKFSFDPHLYMDIFDDKHKPELFAWCEFIKLIVKGENNDGDGTFGVIVDSELGDIPNMNNRSIPIYEEYYLPEKFSLVYASADKSDTVQNKIIKKCDQLATERINYLEKHLKEIDKIERNFVNIGRIELG